MKISVKIISILLVLLTCISAVACGGEGDDTSMNNDENVVTDNRTKVGDKVTLGKLDQDGNADVKEDIVWTVIKAEEGRALLLADKCLSYSTFNDGDGAFTWESSTLRDWLNYDFFAAAFTDEEKALVAKSEIVNKASYISLIGETENTEDRVFLLSLEEAKELLGEENVKGEVTEKLRKTAPLTHGKTYCNWWLRTQGTSEYKISAVGYNGEINYGGLRGDIAEAGVRPCIWYLTETNAEAEKVPVALSAAKVGDKVAMGKYEADGNADNGAEDIVWSVVDAKDGKLLLVADKVLDAYTYHAEVKDDAAWNNATLKLWLNGAFMNKAFGEDEKAKIVTSTLNTPAADGTAITTYNQMFVLSAEELLRYFPEREDRMIEPTAAAVVGGVYVDPINGTCDYWVREAGTTAGNGAYIYYYGDVNEAGALARSTFIGVRPAMWVLP